MIVLGPASSEPGDSRWKAIRALFPDAVRAAFVEPSETPPALFPEEEAGVARAVPSRQREFALGRWCARVALADLGVQPVALPISSDRSPRWPEGIVGSISHCAGFVGAVVAHSRHISGIGLDVEPAVPLGDDLVHLICRPEEVAWAAGTASPPAANWAKVIFSAKEAVHKCIAPLSGVMLDFREVTLLPTPASGTFTARVVRPDTGRLPDFARLVGRFIVTGEFVFASAFIDGGARR